jgi:hypothetical protein
LKNWQRIGLLIAVNTKEKIANFTTISEIKRKMSEN